PFQTLKGLSGARGDDQGDHAAGKRFRNSIAHFGSPGDVAYWEEVRPQPTVKCPDWVSRWVWNPAVIRSRHQFTGILQGNFRGKRQYIQQTHHAGRAEKRQPIHSVK